MHASATLVCSLEEHIDEVARLLFSPDGKTLAAADDSTITLWDVETGSLRSSSGPLDDMFFQIGFSPDNRWIAAASDDGYSQIWSTETGELEHTLNVEDERTLSLAFSSDSKLIATGSQVLRIWDVTTGELLHTLSAPGDHFLSFTAVYERNEHPAEICTVSFSPDNKWLISASSDTRMHKSIQTYETLTWQLRSTIADEGQEVLSSKFSPNSKIIVTFSERQIKLWCIESGEAIRTSEDPVRKVSALVISPGGKILITGTRKCGLRIWSVENGDCLLMLEPEGGTRDRWNPNGFRGGPPAFEVLFSDVGAKAAIAFPDGSIKLWDVRWEST